MDRVQNLLARVGSRRVPSIALGAGRDSFIVWRGLRSSDSPLPVEYWRLRRNVHRLEKALTHRPLRTPFAGNYLPQTVSDFTFLAEWQGTSEVHDVLQWAESVLVEVLGVLGRKDVLATLPKVTLQPVDMAERPVMTPYRRREWLTGDRASLEDVVAGRRSTRWFLDAPVDRSVIDRCVLLASEAPSACNRQPFRVDVVLDGQTKSGILRLAPGTAGFRDQVPAVACVVGDFSAFEHPRDRRLPYIDGSLFAMQLMLALDRFGYASCPINWPELPLIDSKSRGILELKPWEKIIMLVAIGVPDPDGHVPSSPKRSLESLRRWV